MAKYSLLYLSTNLSNHITTRDEHWTGLGLDWIQTIANFDKIKAKNYMYFILRRFGLFLIHLQSKKLFFLNAFLVLMKLLSLSQFFHLTQSNFGHDPKVL